MRKSTDSIEDQIKRLAIIGVFAEDEFLDLLVLKGGNALDLVLGVSTRASMDLDFSMSGAFDPDDLDRVKEKLEASLSMAYWDQGFVTFDVTLERRPPQLTQDMADFWGGYEVTFKVIGQQDHDRLAGDIEALRRQCVQVGGKGKVSIEISCHEHTDGKESFVIDGYQIYAYTPAMIVAEKLRAICQQMPEYAEIVKKSHSTARARDFVDIHATIQHFRSDHVQ